MPQTSIRAKITQAAPQLAQEIELLASEWLERPRQRLDRGTSLPSFPKKFNDPVWGVIELLPWEVLLLDSPLLQRLRGVRQLGMAYQVYPGAVHDRLEHIRGVVEAADRMLLALTRNAEHRMRFGRNPDPYIPLPDDLDRTAVRLAALLHDIGHGPFSHVTEPLIKERHSAELLAVEDVLRSSFEGVTQIAASELLAAMIVLSRPLQEIFEHPKFGATSKPSKLAAAIAARILGSRSHLKAQYLSGIISGPLDADKLDYMARDSHHAGLPLNTDFERLISKLEVVTVTPDTAPKPELRDRAAGSPNQRFHEIGISMPGLSAYEQMIVSRVVLYDRLYYHHKVRAAESMVRRLVALAEEERGTALRLKDFFMGVADDSMILLLGGELESKAFQCAGPRSRSLATAIRTRDLYYRAFAFAARFIGGLGELPEQEEADTRAWLWIILLDKLAEQDQRTELERRIYLKALKLSKAIPELDDVEGNLFAEHIIIDLPPNKVTVRGSDILTRTETDDVALPNLFFDPERWSQAYEAQKQCGYVFCKLEHLAVAALASRIVFYEELGLRCTPEADQSCKTVGLIKEEWLTVAVNQGLVTAETFEAYQEERVQLITIKSDHIRLPDEWLVEEPALKGELERSFSDLLPAGLPAGRHRAVCDALEHLAYFLEVVEKSGKFVGREDVSEAELQRYLRDHLQSRGVVDVHEGSEVGGGETDLILPGPVVVENKVRGKTKDPFEAGHHYAWQARRYGIALHSSQVIFTVVCYEAADERAYLPIAKRIRVSRPEQAPEGSYVQIRIVIPWTRFIPSRAKAPKDTDLASVPDLGVDASDTVVEPIQPSHSAKPSSNQKVSGR